MQKGKIEEDERLIYDILGNIVVIELIEDDNECETPRNPNFIRNDKMVILVKIRNFFRSQMMKRTSPLESSREI